MKLYSNRNLETVYVYIPSENPFLLQSSPSVMDWFWAVDPTFLAWALRASKRAKEAGRLKARDAAKFEELRAYCRKEYGSAINGVPAAAANPVALPPIHPSWFEPTFRTAMGMTGSHVWPAYQNDLAKWGSK